MRVISLCLVLLVFTVQSREDCGRPRVEFLKGFHIYNGDVANKGNFPWMVSLERKDHVSEEKFHHQCGGALISGGWIVTAAHCFEVKGLHLYRVVLGQHDRTKEDEEGKQYFKLKHVEMHDAFWIQETDDIALIKVDGEIKYSKWVQPICAPRSGESRKWLDKVLTNQPKTLDCYVAGWGRTENGTRSRFLRYTDMKLLPQAQCQEHYEPELYDPKTNLCAKDPDDTLQDSCKGDSGGPIFCRRWKKNRWDKRWRMYGLVSWGELCGLEGNPPGIYTNIISYRGWIKKKIKAYQRAQGNE